MITSSSSFGKKIQLQSGSMSNILLRTDGFKKVVKGLSYKRGSSNTNLKSSHNIHTSMGKRSVMKHYEINNQYETKDTQLYNQDKSQQFRRTKTAEYNRHSKKSEVEDRERLFLEAQASERECFKGICQKLGI